jgi:DNA helicase-2/ATP-dependent DNA helicase PcrA
MLDGPLAALLLLPRHGEKTKKGQDIKRLRGLHVELRQEVEAQACGQICRKILEAVGVTAEILEDLRGGVTRKADEARKRKDAIDMLLDCADRVGKVGHDGLAEMMDNISTLISAQEAATERVTVSTVHSAKGLEWAHVFVMGLNQGVFPSGGNLEEERRLFYVAATRARDDLTLTYSLRIRNNYGELMPSEASIFIQEAEAAGTAIRGWE